MQETWIRSLGWEDPLEEGMATHSSILAWRIPETEEPGGPQSTASQRGRHDWSDWACLYLLGWLSPLMFVCFSCFLTWTTFQKYLLNLLQYWFYFMFGFFLAMRHVGSWTRIPCFGERSLNHWSTREVLVFFPLSFLFLPSLPSFVYLFYLFIMLILKYILPVRYK